MRRPRGTRDLFGLELESVRKVMYIMNGIFKRYGYVEVETPIFEHLELFTKKSGASVVNQIYAFQDKSGRWLALRPELTAPVVRFYLERLKSFPKPLKLFYFGSCFRYEEPQAGRYRQFLQSGAEIIGSSRPEADAEVIALVDDIAKELGLRGYDLRVGNVGLLREILSQAGVKGEEQDPVMRAIDAHDQARLEEELDRRGVGERYKRLLKTVAGLQGGVEVLDKAGELLSDLSKARAALQRLRAVLRLLELSGVDGYRVDLGIARGLEYYTDVVFELYVDGVQVAGGGRYDELIELLGGEPCPAVGVGFGVDRIAQAMLKQGVKIEEWQLDCMVLPSSGEMLDECLKIARDLRRAGLSVDVDLMGRSLRKAIAYADARRARYAVIVGARDLASGKVTLRNMTTGEQELVSREELANKLKEVRAT
ncbi:MAG: histidine--tRNA ligase [Candidatus Hadarchaeales archaeon]